MSTPRNDGMIILSIPKACTWCKFYRRISLNVNDCIVKPSNKLRFITPSKNRQSWCPIQELKGEKNE